MHQKHAYAYFFLQKGEEELLHHSPQMEVEKLTNIDIFYVLPCLDWCMIILGLILSCVAGGILAAFYILFTASIKVVHVGYIVFVAWFVVIFLYV